MLLYNDVYVGLELEYEGVNPDQSRERLHETDEEGAMLWEVESDGSLRPRDNNTEFKFAAPLAGAQVLEALDVVVQVVQPDDYQLSWRCGMHVHVDNRPLPWEMAANQAVLACMLDRLWFGWDGTGRHESKFCVPISQVWGDMLPTGRAYRRWATLETFKYSGLNIQRARPNDINTVEYRYPACTKSFDRMVEFINLATWCRHFVLQFPNSEDIVRTFTGAGTFTNWIRWHVPPALQGAWGDGVRRLQGPDGPTSLEIEAGQALAHVISACNSGPEQVPDEMGPVRGENLDLVLRRLRAQGRDQFWGVAGDAVLNDEALPQPE